jgi:hypothetical protein
MFVHSRVQVSGEVRSLWRSNGLRVLLVLVALVALVGSLATAAFAGVGGSISGTVTDPSGAVVAKATVTVKNLDTGIEQTVVTDGKGFYSFTSLPVGRYDLEIASGAFQIYRRTAITVDANSALTIDAVLTVGEISGVITVVENAVHVETTSTQNGQVISGAQMTAVPLNGRSFTDLLTLQPGVAPATSVTSDTVQDVGASVLSPSGDLNPGTISINGQREFANSFIVNGSDVEEDVKMGAAVIPNLDAIAEFRILTNSFDAEYGEFSGGQVNVVTKSGSNAMFLSFRDAPGWMLGIIFRRRAGRLIRTSLAEQWAGRFGATRFSFSRTIKGRDRHRAWIAGRFRCLQRRIAGGI